MSVQYLVDYENVHESGIQGMDALTAEDCVYLFHTSNADRISLSCLDYVQAWVKVILVPPGKQSLDMHLGSFLGYLIGRETDPETRYAIISHDMDYLCIADFWNSSFKMSNKVQCLYAINNALFPDDTYNNENVSISEKAERIVIRKFIVEAFSKYGFIDGTHRPFMLVSDLCTMLNSLPAYNKARKRLNKKPLRYLREECRDILAVDRKWNQDWVYLLKSDESDLAETDAEETGKEPAADESAPEDNVPDIMNMGDLTIVDDPSLLEECTCEETASAEKTEEPVQEEDNRNEPDMLTAATAFILNADTERNADGYVRASALRDKLMTYPAFRDALKESGQKPIPYIQQLFRGYIRIRREKGIWWAAAEAEEESKDSMETAGNDPVAEDRRKKFCEQAFANIRKQLADAGMEQNVADEIADICMRAHSDAEPRKVIHTLLCRRYGTKIGAQYYRKAVRYMNIA